MSDGLFAPRPVRADSKHGRTLLALEITDCKCPDKVCQAGRDGYPAHCPGEARCKDCPQAICQHVRSADHRLSLELWVELMQAYDQEGYRDPPVPREPALVLTKVASLAILIARSKAGEALHHPDDLWRKIDLSLRADSVESLAIEHLQIQAELGKWQGGVSCAGDDEEEEVVPVEVRARLADRNPDKWTKRAIHFDELAERARGGRK